MSVLEIELSPRAPAPLDPGFVRCECVLRRRDQDRTEESRLWYDVPRDVTPLAMDDAEPFLIAAVFDAMREARRIRVCGAVGRELLSNLQEFMVAWSKWVPGTYRPVEIEVDTIVSDGPGPAAEPGTAVAAFSGGVDASCTVWRHSQAMEGHRSRRIVAGILIQGFDIRLDQAEKFDWSLGNAKDTLASVGVPALPLKTNFREAIRTNWDHSHGAAVVAALQFFKTMAPAGLVGSSKPYNGLVFPYGSNPVSDPLLSSSTFAVLHDGSRFDRTEKVAEISRWPEGKKNLRVCWKGSQTGANCGKCEKCIRTKLSFLALGVECPTSLGAPPTVREILGLSFASRAILVDFTQILENCRRHRVQGRWILPLRIRLFLHPLFAKVFHLRWKAKRLLGKG